jgi:hypothetical protein
LQPAASPAPAPRRALPARALAIAALLSALLAIAGCGSSTSVGTSANPAGAIPASAALYAGAVVRPQGALSSDALAAGKALTHQANPYLRLLAALQTPGAPTLEYKRDVAPWLGPNAGVYLTSLSAAGPLGSLLVQGLLGNGAAGGKFPFSAGGAQGAIVLDTSDVSKAQSFLNGQAKHAGASPRSYRGVSYELSPTGVAFAVVKRFAVIGSEAGVHGVIDTTSGSPSLAQASGYAKLLAAAPPGALAHLYANPATAKGRASAQSGEQGISGLMGALTSGHESNISLVPSAGSLALDADTLATGSTVAATGLLSADPQSVSALEGLPAESWLAIGLGHAGSTLSTDVQELRALLSLTGAASGSGVEAPASSTLSVKSLLEGIVAPLEALGANTAQAKRQFASWMGSAGLFASGGSLLELKAGVVIESKNAALSRAAVSALGAVLRKNGGSIQPARIAGTEAAASARLTGLPLILYIAAGRNSSGQPRFVLGLGEASVTAALNSSSTLAGSSTRSAAASTLGEGTQPSIIASLPTFLTLLEGVGLTEDPTISKLLPYLRSITTVVGGGRELGGGIQRFRLVVGLQPAGR